MFLHLPFAIWLTVVLVPGSPWVSKSLGLVVLDSCKPLKRPAELWVGVWGAEPQLQVQVWIGGTGVSDRAGQNLSCWACCGPRMQVDCVIGVSPMFLSFKQDSKEAGRAVGYVVLC